MKYNLHSIILCAALLAFSVITVPAATNQPTTAEIVTSTAKQIVATNINQVMVEILSGVKNASGEMYKFSKQEVGQAYDFLKDQAPQVIQEFIVWKMAEAIVWAAIFGSVGGLLFYFARQLKLRAKDTSSYYRDDYNITKWVMRVVACILLVISLGVCGMRITQIAVAPRVFIIEYVVATINGK